MKLLLVEDDIKIATAVKRGLEAEGFVVDVANDGIDGLWLATEGTFDLIVLDIMLPGRNGYSVCSELRRAGDWTPVLMLTAKDGDLDEAEALDTGADDYLRKPPDPDELQVRMISARRITALHRQLSQQNAELERLNLALFEQGRTDPLTRVGNRLRMQEDLTQLWSRARRAPALGFCVALCDIDHFKVFNDTCGHQAGDEVLRTVASTLTAKARGGDAVYRYGGEEFLVMLSEPALDKAVVAMHRLHVAIAELAIPHPKATTITVSVGVARHADDKPLDDLIKEADVALYVAKSRGRNCVVSFDAIDPLEAQALAFAKR